jgi:1-acyl-sn-glycerol-3-phosphate acyltransferase
VLAFLPPFLKVPLAALLVLLNTIFWFIPLMLLALVRLVVPFAPLRGATGRALVRMAECWISVNNGVTDLFQRIHWDVELPPSLRRAGSYLVIANHQSWADIVVLQRVFNRRIPFLRFFLKRQLMWVPLLGLAWWALDFPFMRRHSREYLERHPEKRNEDLEVTRAACARFAGMPVSIMSFVEGTRFTITKHDAQRAPYRHLLNPKAGGIAFTLNAMNGAIRTLLDVTIVYRPHRADFGDLFSGRLKSVIVRVREHVIPERFLCGDYQNDAQWREAFQAWLREVWQRKDDEIDSLLARAAA